MGPKSAFSRPKAADRGAAPSLGPGKPWPELLRARRCPKALLFCRNRNRKPLFAQICATRRLWRNSWLKPRVLLRIARWIQLFANLVPKSEFSRPEAAAPGATPGPGAAPGTEPPARRDVLRARRWAGRSFGPGAAPGRPSFAKIGLEFRLGQKSAPRGSTGQTHC